MSLIYRSSFPKEKNPPFLKKKAFSLFLIGYFLRVSKEKRKALCHPYPSLKEKIEKYGYDGKQLHHIIRVNDFIRAYVEDYSFEECLTYLPNKDEMLKAKINGYSLEDALELADNFDKNTKELKNHFLKEKDEINKEALDLLNKIQCNAIKRKLKEDIRKEEE